MGKVKQNRSPVVILDYGLVRLTPSALDRLDQEDITQALSRHIVGDWGEVDLEEWQSNDKSLRSGFRILSAYVDRNSQKFWIVTEADRSTTTIMLPEEY